MRIKLEELIVARVASGLPWLKVYADKIYNKATFSVTLTGISDNVKNEI
jgi:hypothetical protein